MLFDPLAHHAIHLKREDLHQSDVTDFHGALSPLVFVQNTHPIASYIAADELGKLFRRINFRDVFRNLFGTASPKRESSVSIKQAYENRLGLTIPVNEEVFPDMLAEVNKFKWLEAERAGRDIWAERNPSDPEVPALAEWFRLHFGAWYLAHRDSLQRQSAR